MSYSHMTMKDLPETERPYEKAMNYGVSSCSDAELLAIILRTGTKQVKVLDLANQLLLIDEQNTGLLGLLHASAEELKQIKGIGSVKAIQVSAIFELSKRVSKLQGMKKIKVTSPETVADTYMSEMRYLEQEQFRIICLDTKNQIVAEPVMSIGTVNASLVHPREVFIEALRQNAVNIILMHNHPSGDPTPSREDKNITRRLQEAGELLGVKVLDHIIIGDGRYCSLKAQGICS